jgi:hypothetical protein
VNESDEIRDDHPLIVRASSTARAILSLTSQTKTKMRVSRLLRSKAIYLGALLFTAALFLARSHWEQEQIKASLASYLKAPLSFKLYRSDNYRRYYVEDLVQIQISPDIKELLIVRHTPRDDPLRLPIEEAHLETNQTVMLLTHRHGNLYRIYLHPESFMLTVVGNLKNVLAMETGVKLSEAQVQLFKQDPLYQGAGAHL